MSNRMVNSFGREMSREELDRRDRRDAEIRSRYDSFDHGGPERILHHWNEHEPCDQELRAIIKNILNRMSHNEA